MTEHFEIIPIVSAILWLFILVLIAGLIRSNNLKKDHYRFFLPAFFAKIISSIIFSLVYLVYYEGGDTVAYWDGATTLQNLLFNSPSRFINEMFTTPELMNMGVNFNWKTGYPPGWIYREPESFFVSKISFFFSLITIKSYLASSLIVAFLMSLSSWYFYCSMRLLKLHNEKVLAYCILFTPTVLFWCTGISKDSYVLIALLILVSVLIRFFILEQKFSKTALMFFVSVYLIYCMRLYVLIAFLPAMLMAYSARLSRKNLDSSFKRRSIKVGFFILSGVVLYSYFEFSGGASQVQDIFNEIIVTQQDFANNTTYGDKKYNLNLTSYDIPSLIAATPAALIAAFFRPFPWEALSPLFIFNGLENTILIVLTILFFLNRPFQKIRFIISNEILMFSFIFILVMGFSIGFTSGLFGVLVRFKSLILPFLLILLTVDYGLLLKKDEQETLKATRN
jgi:hypothetical protein